MQIFPLFYKWVPKIVQLLLLLIFFFVILVCNGVFLGNTTDMYSSLGEYAEYYTQAYNAMYVGMGLGMIVAVRLKMRFTSKALLLYGLVCMLLMNVICATSNNPVIIVAACLFLGFSKTAALIEVFIIWLFVWSKKGDTSRMYPFVYFLALSGLYFTTWLMAKFAYNYDWRHAYLWIVIFILSCILFTVIFVENHPLKRPLPLYQMDWIGLILITAGMMLIDYIVVWGKVEDWFNSNKIIAAFFLLLISLLVFISRSLQIKRPVIDLAMFKQRTFRVGLIHFILLGLFIPSTFQSAFSGSILRYETLQNVELNLYLIPGIFIGAVLCFIWYYRKWPSTLLIFLGFLFFVVYHVIMYNSFSLNFDIKDFWPPSIIKGFSMVVLYISVGLYTTNKFEISTVMSGAGIVIIVRSFLGSGIFTALYGYWLYTGRQEHFNHLAGMIDNNDALLKELGGSAGIYRSLQEQAILTTSKEISGYIIITGAIILAGMIAAFIFSAINRRMRTQA